MMLERISSKAEIYGGKPCITGTRITVTMILELLEDGLSFEEIRRDYYPHLVEADIRACLKYARTVIEGQEIHFVAEAATS
jgi:uncharacterized protein (DUF433 family)